MQYLGGKTRIAKQLAAIINKQRGSTPVWDAFCGGLSMSVALGDNCYSSDGNRSLIATYQAVQRGWIPPTVITEKQYEDAKTLHDDDPLKAFIAIGCSFGGKWFGGYARCKDPKDKRSVQGYAINARNHIIANVTNKHIYWIDFLKVIPKPINAVLYLDPPYAGTTGYKGVAPFDHQLFYDRASAWSRFTTVFISEYSSPIGSVVWEKSVNTSLARGANSPSTERLYIVQHV